MLLALDAGNTNITIGVFDQDRLVRHWRLRTVHDQTADEWGILLRNLFALADLALERIDGIIVASVVPPLESTLAAMARRYKASSSCTFSSACLRSVMSRINAIPAKISPCALRTGNTWLE